MVPVKTIVFMVTDMLLGIAVPLALLLFFRKKYKATLRSFFVGCAVMLLFALVLEQLVHTAVLGSEAGDVIRNNVWLYALYGSLAAGLFEECGRFLAMKYVLKREHDAPCNSLMYGAGHGGFEMFVLLFFGMINNLIYSVMLNRGSAGLLMSPLDAAGREALQAAFDALIQTPSWQFLVSPLERLAAITAQLALSVIVWSAAVGKRKYMFPLAIFLHAFLDAVAVITSGLGVPLLAVEGIVWIIAAGYALFARKVWKETLAESPPEEPEPEADII